MQIKGTKSEKNIMAAFEGESKARNKYTFYAMKAISEGNVETADLFEKMANNEREHAKIWFKMLNEIGTTNENVKDAAAGESYEWLSMYPEFAKVAREEGLDMLAEMFEKVAGIEQTHEERFLKEYIKLQSGNAVVTPAQQKPVYRCEFCGHTEAFNGQEPLPVCPVCEAIGAFVKTML